MARSAWGAGGDASDPNDEGQAEEESPKRRGNLFCACVMCGARVGC